MRRCLLACHAPTFLAPVVLLVDGGPSSPLGFILGYATPLIAFLDVFGLALLLAGVTGLVATWHGGSPAVR
jgi:hypothetical protein